MPPVIVPIATALAPAISTAFGVSLATATSIATVSLEIALSVGLSAAAAAVQRASFKDRGAMGQGLQSTDIRLNTRQEIPMRRWVYGEVLLGGPLFFERSVNPLYYQGFLLSEGPVTACLEVRNTQEKMTVAGGYPHNTIVQPSSDIEGRPSYVGNVRICFRDGRSGQTVDALLDDVFDDFTNSKFRQRDTATLTFEANYGGSIEGNEQLWGSSRRPNPIVLLRGVPVYDPRNPAHVLPSNPNDYGQVQAARATWSWSNTAALVQADYLWRDNGGRIPLHRLNWDKIADAANYDDSMINTKEGELIRRHTIDGIVTAGQRPVEILQSMLTANRGFIVRSRGKVWVQSSRAAQPVMTLTDKNIAGGITMRRSQPKRNLVNRVRTRFIDPRQQWTMVDGPIREMTSYQTADRDLYEATLELPFTADHRRAQRLAKLYVEESRLGRSLQTTVDVQECFGLEAGDVIRVEHPIFPYANGIYRLNRVKLIDNVMLQLDAIEYDAAIEDSWNPTSDQLTFDLPALDVDED